MDESALKYFLDMKSNIEKVGGYFYQYRACNMEETSVYDVDNIRYGVVYARTPLQMNDPFDSIIGFSTEEICDECINLAFNQIFQNQDAIIKQMVMILLKYKLMDDTLGFVTLANKVKKYIRFKMNTSHVQTSRSYEFIVRNIDVLYKKCPDEIKKRLRKNELLATALMAIDLKDEEINGLFETGIAEIFDGFEELEREVINVRDNVYLPQIKDIVSRTTVTCFSLSGWDNQLMWSHYANSYSGVCIEYDFNKMNSFVGFMLPVSYSDERPTMSLKDLGINNMNEVNKCEVDVEAILSYLLIKNKCWEYEHEWRLINIGDEAYTPIFIDLPYVKSVTFGFNFYGVRRRFLLDVCKEKEIPCYQLVANSNDYVLTREPISEKNFSFDDKEEIMYIDFILKRLAKTGENINSSWELLNKPIEDDSDTTLMLRVLQNISCYISDALLLKRSYNRYCDCMEAEEKNIKLNYTVMQSVKQIDALVMKLKEIIESSQIICLLNILSSVNQNNRLCKVNWFRENINDMINKYNTLKWFEVSKVM